MSIHYIDEKKEFVYFIAHVGGDDGFAIFKRNCRDDIFTGNATEVAEVERDERGLEAIQKLEQYAKDINLSLIKNYCEKNDPRSIAVYEIIFIERDGSLLFIGDFSDCVYPRPVIGKKGVSGFAPVRLSPIDFSAELLEVGLNDGATLVSAKRHLEDYAESAGLEVINNGKG